MTNEEEYKNIIRHLADNRKVKAKKLTEIEKVVLNCINTGHNNKYIQKIYDIIFANEDIYGRGCD